MIQERIEALLKEKIGLSANIIGSAEIIRAVERRRVACELSDLPAYFQLLQISDRELEELIELVIVPETWFFRDWEPFVFLERYVTSEWLSNQSYRILRVLSVPCSTGEEPYSIAMTLLNAGLSVERFRIDAIDISKISLDKAREAIYNQNSFRGNNQEFQKQYFTKIDDKYHLSDRVKNAVNFMYGNIINQNFLNDKSNYDIIFCRNVLIYFDSLAREQSLQNLTRLLTKEGLLFLGHAETGQMLGSEFVSVKHPFAFAYRRHNNKQQKVTEEGKSSVKKQTFQGKNNAFIYNNPALNQNIQDKLNAKDIQSPPNSVKIRSIKSNEDKSNVSSPKISLEAAQKLADSGQLNEAAKMCENYLKENNTCGAAYILMGQISQALGSEEQAEKYLQKALYLQPNSQEALLLLSLIKENRGDAIGAEVLRQRLRRLQKS